MAETPRREVRPPPQWRFGAFPMPSPDQVRIMGEDAFTELSNVGCCEAAPQAVQARRSRP
eukprot:15441176-Alexandrium_andersonii.AAC.1